MSLAEEIHRLCTGSRIKDIFIVPVEQFVQQTAVSTQTTATQTSDAIRLSNTESDPLHIQHILYLFSDLLT